jgi:hypothetical protein
VRSIAEMLKINSGIHTLEKIDLGVMNQIKGEGARSIAEMLKFNSTLKEINLNSVELTLNAALLHNLLLHLRCSS